MRKRLILLSIFTGIFSFSLNKNNFNFKNLIPDFIYNEYTKYVLKTSDFNKNICIPLDNKIRSIIYPYENSWGITLIKDNSDIIVDINSNKQLIPASNTKLFSTAYALSKLGPNSTLSTKVYKNSSGNYEVLGQGDPDLNINHVKEISDSIINNKFLYKKNNKILLYEIKKEYWWPEYWHKNDKLESYGAPITKLALTSNSNTNSVQNPINRFSNILASYLSTSNIEIPIKYLDLNLFNTNYNRDIIYVINSAPIYMLLNLANSESHNFTSEILLRNSAKSWNNKIAIKRLSSWLSNIGIQKHGFSLFDGSGLSRKNRSTTLSLAKILYYMDNHKHRKYYVSSFSLVGYRGTLRNNYISKETYGNFIGKTGTLQNVRSLSGYIVNTPNGNLILSIIQNNSFINLNYFNDILSAIYNQKKCNY
ncbi:D-alanyl-D-alanine carboxypeptidase [Prochlorococcus marinus]|uniref:D-alanyl-D-alanine carboxypeptidase n=1 Tax=Prochlorococcus marinus TaxID=1219 RepID=UPI0022B522F8|nr:D-alanyl-D-alanine carboxypeptidase [Prochlorococcus marinus]